MKKKVLVISASPREKSNSDILCNQFLAGALEAGHKAEKIRLRDKKISYCIGCDYCRSHNGDCIQRDDMTEMLAKMIDADVIVLASPVYFYSINAQLKALIDRSVARYTEISGKEFYYILTAADADKKNMRVSVDCLRAFTIECLQNSKEKGILFGLGVWAADEVKSTPVFQQAYDMGRKC